MPDPCRPNLPFHQLIVMTGQMTSIMAGFLRRQPGGAPQKQATCEATATA
jgi:hypothetical protein